MKSPSLASKISRLSTFNLTSGLLRQGVMRQLSQLHKGLLVIFENGVRQTFGDNTSALVGEV